MAFLRRKLRVEAGIGGGGGEAGRGQEGTGTGAGLDEGSLFCYVNNVFAPGLDEGVGGLWKVSVEFSFCLLVYFSLQLSLTVCVWVSLSLVFISHFLIFLGRRKGCWFLFVCHLIYV